MARKNQYDPEFHIPGEPETKENPSPPDITAYSYQPPEAGEEAPTGHEYSPPPDKDSDGRKEKGVFRNAKGRFILEMAAAMMTVVVVKDAYGYDLLGHDIFNDRKPVSSVSVSVPEPEPEPEPILADWPDKEFPVLSNLEPNGYIEGYGVLNEQYIMFQYWGEKTDTDYVYCEDGVWNRTNDWVIDSEGVHFPGGVVIKDYYYAPNSDYDTEFAKISGQAGSAWYNGEDFLFISNDAMSGYTDLIEPLYKNLPIGDIPGASYDRATNTLTLNNFRDRNAVLNINIMGNGFKIKLVGDNELDKIISWGFHYGGSITFTGDGRLTIDAGDSHGIELQAEDSESCIMIEESPKIQIYAHYGAIWVENPKCAKGLYYKGSMTYDPAYENVHRSFGPFATSLFSDENDYSVVYMEASPMTSVAFNFNFIDDDY